MKETSEARVVVSGRVQGVFFRASTRDVAVRYGVRGFVRNLPDGRVEAVLQGDRGAVEKVVAFMREGPAGGYGEGARFSLTYGGVAAVQLDPIEKKPLFHFPPGTEILSVGSIGCNFRCGFCQNWHLVLGQASLSPAGIPEPGRAARAS